MASLRELAPETRVEQEGMALRVFLEPERIVVWNLADVARIAPSDPDWRAGIAKQASYVLGERPEAETTGLGMRLRPRSRIAAELLTGEWAVEPIVGELYAMYGTTTSEGIQVWKRSALQDRPGWAFAALTLGGDFKFNDMLDPIAEDVPMFTNGTFHPQIACALVMPPQWWNLLLKGLGTESVLVAIPAPSRIFVTPIDTPDMVPVFRQLIAGALEIEEEVLSTDIYRYANDAWTVVSA